MDHAAIAVAALALLVAVLALRAASAARRAAEEAQEDARRRAQNASAELEGRLEATRKLVALVASGAPLDREQILEGRLWRELGPREAEQLVAAGGVRLLDVRSPQETALGIIPGAQLVPIEQLEARLREVPKPGKPLLVYCAGGARSAAACEYLSQHGYDDLINLAGGFQAWNGPRARP
jgi:rhodanese-related sulfurtransferase